MSEGQYRFLHSAPRGRPTGVKVHEQEKQSYLTKYDRFIIAKFHIDGAGIGILLTVWSMNVFNSGVWLVSALSFIIMVVIAFGAIKKGKYLDTLVESEGDQS